MPPEHPDDSQGTGVAQVEDLLASQDLARVLDADEFKSFLDHVAIGVATSRRHKDRHRIVYANGALAKMCGVPAGEIEGKTWEIFIRATREDDPSVTLTEAVREGDDFLGLFRLQREQGTPLLVQAYASQISHEDGSENYRIVALVDVTEQRSEQRQAFEQKLVEKDMLLKELQHRVKNNLQLITAMIRLEARGAERGEQVDMAKLAGRIEALALLYEALEMDRTVEEIDLGHYLGQIAAAAMRVHAREGIGLDLKTSYSPVSINVAMPVGLLINELFTNAFKYAFVGQERGQVALSCEHTPDEHYRVTFGDTGAGLPAGESWPRRGKLGALILDTLQENCPGARLEVDSAAGAGTKVTISFMHRPPSARRN